MQLKSEWTFDQIVCAVKQLSLKELGNLFSQVSVRPLYDDHRLSKIESELLIKINQGVPKVIQRRYSDLIVKRKDRTLTDEEYKELLKLTDQIESFDVKRIEYLSELARIRNKPLMLLLDELKIRPPTVYA